MKPNERNEFIELGRETRVGSMATKQKQRMLLLTFNIDS